MAEYPTPDVKRVSRRRSSFFGFSETIGTNSDDTNDVIKEYQEKLKKEERLTLI